MDRTLSAQGVPMYYVLVACRVAYDEYGSVLYDGNPRFGKTKGKAAFYLIVGCSSNHPKTRAASFRSLESSRVSIDRSGFSKVATRLLWAITMASNRLRT